MKVKNVKMDLSGNLVSSVSKHGELIINVETFRCISEEWVAQCSVHTARFGNAKYQIFPSHVIIVIGVPHFICQKSH